MNGFLQGSNFFGLILTIAAFGVGLLIKKRINLAVFNPLLIAIAICIAVLLAFHIDYKTYYDSAKYITYLLTPATVCLSILLYKQLELLKNNWKAILGGISAGVLANLFGVFALSYLFGLTHEQYVTLLPKSITNAIGIGLSEQLGGIVTITAVSIALTGILGHMVADFILKTFHITEPIAKGLALGTSSHAMGTVKAIGMGEVEGAVSSLSIVVAGLITVIGASFFAPLI